MENMESEMYSQLIQLTSNNQEIEIIEILSNNDSINLSKIIDSSFYSLLHKATLNNQYSLFSKFILYQQQYCLKYQKDEQIEEFINLKTDEGFTALHFASFRGNLEMIKDLLDLGADIKEQNNQGLSVMHIAAQGNQPRSMAFFFLQNVILEGKDFKNCTPLHWACFLGCENSVNFLLSWNVNLNGRDSEGLTPLHLAVINGNGRIVRALLVKGSDRFIKDYKNQTPLDIARENQFENIMKMLQLETTLSEYCNVTPSFKPSSKQKRRILLFISYFTFEVFLFVVLYFPNIDVYLQIFISSFFLMTYMLFFLTLLIEPGYYQKQKYEDKQKEIGKLLELFSKNEPSNICAECNIVKPRRSRHCAICKRCVQRYDHHCPWINNCVGIKNHKYFLMFILILFFDCFIVMIISSIYIKEDYGDNYLAFLKYLTQSDETQTILKQIFTGFNYIYCLSFLVPLSVLLYVQINNFLFGKTTFERFSKSKTQNKSERSLQNFIGMCSTNEQEQKQIDNSQPLLKYNSNYSKSIASFNSSFNIN